MLLITAVLTGPRKQMFHDILLLNNGFKLDEPIFNIEFEMRRSHLRAYNIQSVEQLLSNAQKLFYNAMNDIRLIDLNKVSKKLKIHF